MSAPSKELERLIMGHAVRHGTHPILTWNVAKVAKQEDAAGNIKPSKAKSMHKIDRVISLIMGIGVASLSSLAEESIYDTRGIRTLR
jgi:phage terminase large subunit-like protein